MIVSSASSQSKPRLTGSSASASTTARQLPRNGERDVAGIGAQRRHRREHGRAGRAGRAADDEHRAGA